MNVIKREIISVELIYIYKTHHFQKSHQRVIKISSNIKLIIIKDVR